MGDLLVGSIPPLEIALDLIRIKRNELLKNSDFYILSDYPITEGKRNEWKTYRQQLRDITSTLDESSLIMIEANGEIEVGGFTWPQIPI